MAKEISIIRQEAQQVQNATQVGENTAQRVGGVLTDIVDKIATILGATYMGVATPTTAPIVPDGNIFYIASQPGTYPNFNGISVNQGEIAIFTFGDNTWTKTEVPINLSDGSVTFEKLDASLKEAIRNIELLSSGESPLIVGKIDVSELDWVISDIVSICRAEKPLRYIVLSSSYVVGVLDVFSDNMGHVLTQIISTHYTLNSDGTLNIGAHRDDTIYTYKRSFNLSAPSLDIPQGTWGKWQEAHGYEVQAINTIGLMTVSEINLSNNVGNVNVVRDVSPYILGKKPMVYIITDDTGNYTTGLLIMSSDDSGHSLHQTLITSRTITEDGASFLGHNDFGTYTYQRTLMLSSAGGDTQYKWSAWKINDSGGNGNAIVDISIIYDAKEMSINMTKADGSNKKQKILTATTSQAGVMSAADKEKLDGITETEYIISATTEEIEALFD